MELEKYIISIEKNGRMVPVGSISGEENASVRLGFKKNEKPEKQLFRLRT